MILFGVSLALAETPSECVERIGFAATQPMSEGARDRLELERVLCALDATQDYEQRLALGLGEEVDAVTLHAWGLREVERAQDRMQIFAAGQGWPVAWEELRVFLEEQPTLPSEVQALLLFEAEAHRTHRKLGLDIPECVVMPGEGGGSYREGAFMAPLWLARSFPRALVRGLTVHECVPGHHLQRQSAGPENHPPFTEGWATYAEQVVAPQAGLFDDPQDELGLLALALWRAGRVVCETGVAAHGWTEWDAARFLATQTWIPLPHLRMDVERLDQGPWLVYHWAGQARFRQVREAVEALQGPDFDVDAFHDALLTGGTTTLPRMVARAERYAGEPLALPSPWRTP